MITMVVKTNAKSVHLSDARMLSAYHLAFVKAGQTLTRTTEQLAALKTGALRGSITMEIEREAHSVVAHIGYDNSVSYALMHENWPIESYRRPTTPRTVPRAMKTAAELIMFESIVEAQVDLELVLASV